jgi:hypothetical protein
LQQGCPAAVPPAPCVSIIVAQENSGKAGDIKEVSGDLAARIDGDRLHG